MTVITHDEGDHQELAGYDDLFSNHLAIGCHSAPHTGRHGDLVDCCDHAWGVRLL